MNPCPVCSNTLFHKIFEVPERFLQKKEPLYQIMECTECGLGRTEPFPSLETIPHLYPPNYSGDVERVVNQYLQGKLEGTSSWRMETEKVKLLEKFKKSGRILDVGCAEGKFLWALDKNQWKRYGLELNHNTLELVRGKVRDVTYISGDLNLPQLQDEYFDVITLWHVLEHTPNPREAVKRIWSLLKDNGIAVISVANLDCLQIRVFGKYWYPFDDVPRHLYHFRSRTLKRLLQEAGFDFISQKFFSKSISFHSWKHSTLNWSRARLGGKWAYYTVKPLLFLMPALEWMTQKPGIITQIVRKPSSNKS